MINIIDHPVVKHKLTEMRKKNTSTVQFRQLTNELAALMVYEVTRDLPVKKITIETPITVSEQETLDGKKLVIVPILRAGLGMMDGMLSVIPTARVGHVGVYRDETTLKPIEYFVKLPKDLDRRIILVVDPMLATGGSANMAIDLIKSRGGKNIKLVCLVGSQVGIDAVSSKHPDVDIVLAARDEKLNEQGYIVPGLGDAGDRIFGTK